MPTVGATLTRSRDHLGPRVTGRQAYRRHPGRRMPGDPIAPPCQSTRLNSSRFLPPKPAVRRAAVWSCTGPLQILSLADPPKPSQIYCASAEILWHRISEEVTFTMLDGSLDYTFFEAGEDALCTWDRKWLKVRILACHAARPASNAPEPTNKICSNRRRR